MHLIYLIYLIYLMSASKLRIGKLYQRLYKDKVFQLI